MQNLTKPKPYKKVTLEEINQITAKHLHDRHTIRRWGRIAARLKAVLIISPIPMAGIVYVVPKSKFNESKKEIELRWKKAVVFLRLEKGVRLLYDPGEQDVNCRGEVGLSGEQGAGDNKGPKCGDSGAGGVNTRRRKHRKSGVPTASNNAAAEGFVGGDLLPSPGLQNEGVGE